tara:strand:+ start:247 stop:462 length:216 start_codon:yes stop_codon:yes gene_type:complete
LKQLNQIGENKMKKLNMKQKQEIRNCKKVISNIKGWLQSNIDAELHEKDLVLDNKDLLFFIDKWEKQNETV